MRAATPRRAITQSIRTVVMLTMMCTTRKRCKDKIAERIRMKTINTPCTRGSASQFLLSPCTNDHPQDAGDPERDSDKETPETAKGFLRPVVERAVVRKHRSQLRCCNDAGKEEGECADDPVGKSSCSCPSCPDRIVDEEYNHQEDHRHIECSQLAWHCLAHIVF